MGRSSPKTPKGGATVGPRSAPSCCRPPDCRSAVVSTLERPGQRPAPAPRRPDLSGPAGARGLGADVGPVLVRLAPIAAGDRHHAHQRPAVAGRPADGLAEVGPRPGPR